MSEPRYIPIAQAAEMIRQLIEASGPESLGRFVESCDHDGSVMAEAIATVLKGIDGE